jgi:hypothetical protein
MNPEEINELLEALIERFRAFVAEEVQKYYNMGKTISSTEVETMLQAFEANEMTKMFNEEKIPQDKFRIFLQRYLRLWFNLFAAKISEADGKIAIVDSLEDLPDDGSVIIAIVNGEMYYWDGEKWRKVCECVPGEIPILPELPDGGSGTNIAIVNGDLYYWDGRKWVKVVTQEDLEQLIEMINNLITTININGRDGDGTYHDTVLEIVNSTPDMNVGDRYLVTSGENEIVETSKILQAGITNEYNGYSQLFVFPDNSAIWGGADKPGKLIFSQGNKTYPVSGFSGTVSDIKYFNGQVYFVGNNIVHWFHKETKSAGMVGITIDNGDATIEQIITRGTFYCAAIGQDGKLYLGTNSLASSAGIWYIDNDGSIRPTYLQDGYFYAAAMGQNGKLYFAGLGVYYLDDDGLIKPTNKTTGVYFDFAAMGANGKLYFGGDGIYYLDDDGQIKATNEIYATTHCAAVGQDGRLYFGGNNKILYLDDDGTIKKKTTVISFSGYCAAMGQDGKLYFGTSAGVWYLDDDGTIKQTNQWEGTFAAAAMGQNGKLYFVAGSPISKGICYLDNDGTIKPTNKTTGVYKGAAMGQDGKLYIYSVLGIDYLDNDGTIKPTNKTTGNFKCAAIGPDGKLYFGASPGIYRLESKSQSINFAALNGLHKFENKLFFNSGTENTARFSYIDSSGNINEGAYIALDTEAANFDQVSVVYAGKLHLFGTNTGLYRIDAGSVTPVHVGDTVFDEPNIKCNIAYAFNGALYVGIKSVSYNRARAIVKWDGSIATACIDVGSITSNPDIVYFGEDGNELFATSNGEGNSEGYLWKLTGSAFTTVSAIDVEGDSAAVWNGKLYYLSGTKLYAMSLDSPNNSSVIFGNAITNPFVQDSRLFCIKMEWDEYGGLSGQYSIHELIFTTVSSNGDVIMIVGRDSEGKYEEDFEEGHRVVVKDSPTGLAREYGIRNGELMDTDGNDLEIPTVGNATLTIKQGGVQKGTFTANAGTDVTIDLDASSGSGSAGTLNTTNTTAQTTSSSESLSGTINLHKVSKTGSYDDLLNTPTIPKIWTGTQAQYDAIQSKDSSTIYMIFIQ